MGLIMPNAKDTMEWIGLAVFSVTVLAGCGEEPGFRNKAFWQGTEANSIANVGEGGRTNAVE
jgi:hypothetical protein